MNPSSFFHRLTHSLLQSLLPEVIVPLPLLGGPLGGMLMKINLKWEREFVYGKFEFEVGKAIQDYVKRGDIVYDVGAHVGYFTLLFARLVGPKGQCLGFEPNPEVFRRLQSNIRMNKWRLPAEVQTMKIGLYDEVGEKRFFLGGSTTTGRLTRFPEDISQSKIIIVPLSTIDALIQEGLPVPSFMKIDVEYAEDHVLRGAINTLKKHGAVVLCEIHSMETGKNCFEILKGIGYSIIELKTGQTWDMSDKVSKGHILATPVKCFLKRQ